MKKYLCFLGQNAFSLEHHLVFFLCLWKEMDSAAPFSHKTDKDDSEKIILKFFDSSLEFATFNFQESPKVLPAPCRDGVCANWWKNLICVICGLRENVTLFFTSPGGGSKFLFIVFGIKPNLLSPWKALLLKIALFKIRIVLLLHDFLALSLFFNSLFLTVVFIK